MTTRRKTKSPDASVRDQLAQKFLAALETDFALHGAGVIAKMRESHPERYAELAGKLILSAEPPKNTTDVNNAQSYEDIGRSLLDSVGAAPDLVTEEMVRAAVALNDRFVTDLENIARSAVREKGYSGTDQASDFHSDERKGFRRYIREQGL